MSETALKRTPTARDRQREATRRRLYEAALAVFRRDGVSAASIEAIAAEAGVSRGTFYFHFATKDDVLAEHLQASQQDIVQRLAGIPQHSEIEPVLEAVAHTIAQQWQADPELFAEMGMVALKVSARQLSESRNVHPARVALVPWFERAAERGELGDLIPPELLADFFLVNLFGASLAWYGNQVMQLDVMLANVVLFFLKAARPDGL